VGWRAALGALALSGPLLLCGPGAATGAPRAARAPRPAAAAATAEPEVVDLLIQLLAGGTTPQRTVAALAALAKLADPRGLEVLELYAGHRRVEVRREAVTALGALRDPRASNTLLERLGDDAPEVRAAAAAALSARREGRAVPRLLRLVRRGDMGAAEPLGHLATADAVAELCGTQGATPDGVLATALGTYVQRPDVIDGTRIEPLRTIAKLHGPEATAALVDYLASIPPRETRTSKREAEQLLDERGAER
jgi:HEAT repeat protein